MSTDDPIDRLADSISDGRSVDWNTAEAGSRDDDDRTTVRGLRDIERIVAHHRRVQRAAEAPLASPRPEPWGDLTLLDLIRSGTSGEVWRAWDAWLQREVALKFLLAVSGPAPESNSGSALLEEARSLARVRHPVVVSVYGIAEHDGRVGMWMELLRGSTLAAEIARRGPLPVHEVLQIGVELAHALVAIGAAGLVHRDIKPSNIVLEEDGRVVLTDFGLGRRWELVDADALRASGTPLFMAPDVLSGEPATPISDLYALGVTLRWALTGRPPFLSRTLEELKTEAASGPSTPLASERTDAPPRLIAAIDRAMTVRPEGRYTGAAEFCDELQVIRDALDSRPRGRSARFAAAAAACILLLGAIVLLAPRFRASPHEPAPVRFTVTAPPGTTLDADPTSSAISPNGRTLAFVAQDSNGTARLWLRPLDAVAAHPIEGTEGATNPFWSPDGRDLGYLADTKLKRVALSGGAPVIVCNAADLRGASWGARGVIVFAPIPLGPICRVSSEGGEPSVIVAPDSTRHETAFRWPTFLPDGTHFLYVVLPGHGLDFDIRVGSIDSKDTRTVFRSGAAPVCTGKSGLIVANNGRLMLQHFDFRRLNPVGEPSFIAAATASDVSVGQRLVSASTNGVLIYPGGTLGNTRLQWLDRTGAVCGTLTAPQGRYEWMNFSPDGQHILVQRRSSPTSVDLWIIERETGLASRFSLVTQSRLGGRPAWSADGGHIAFSSNRSGVSNIYWKSTTGNRQEELLYESNAQFKEVDCWSADGRYIVFEQSAPATKWDLWLLPSHGASVPLPFLQSPFEELAASVSPDGRWIAYTSNRSGTLQVYVTSFPTPGDLFELSPTWATLATWTKGGRELILTGRGYSSDVWSVPVRTQPEFRAGTARLLFHSHREALWVVPTPDGERFLEAVPEGEAPPKTLTVTTNALAGIK